MFGRGRRNTPSRSPFAPAVSRVRRSCERAAVRSHRRALAPAYSTRSDAESDDERVSIQILLRTS